MKRGIVPYTILHSYFVAVLGYADFCPMVKKGRVCLRKEKSSRLAV